MTADTGAVVLSDYQTVDLTENATAQNGMTVVANELVFAQAKRMAIHGTFQFESQGSGGGARLYAVMRAKLNREGADTYPVLMKDSSYGKTTIPNAVLSQGPDQQLLSFHWEFDTEAGDKIAIEWRAYIQTAPSADIDSANSGIGVRFYN